MNIEAERTEELYSLYEKKQKRKKLVLVAVVLICVLGFGGGIGSLKIMEGKHHQEADALIAMGDKELQAGHYEEAVAQYTKAIEIDKKNPKTLVKRANAYVKVADQKKDDKGDREVLKKAEKDYKKAKTLDPKNPDANTGLSEVYSKTRNKKALREVNEEIDKQSAREDNGIDRAAILNRGNSSSNLSNKGFLLETEEGAYIANAPHCGCISRIKEDGTLKTIWEPEDAPEDGSMVLYDLNMWGEYIYFRQEQNREDVSVSDDICKVREDGKEYQKLLETRHEDKESISYGQLRLVDGKLYFFRNTISDEPGSECITTIGQADLDGNNEKTIYAPHDYMQGFEADGSSLFVIQLGDPETDNDSSLIKKLDINSGESQAVYNAEDDSSIESMVLYKDKVYLAARTSDEEEDNAATMAYYRVDEDTLENQELLLQQEVYSSYDEPSEPGNSDFAIRNNELAVVVQDDTNAKLQRINLRSKKEKEFLLGNDEDLQVPECLGLWKETIYFCNHNEYDVPTIGSMSLEGKEYRENS